MTSPARAPWPSPMPIVDVPMMHQSRHATHTRKAPSSHTLWAAGAAGAGGTWTLVYAPGPYPPLRGPRQAPHAQRHHRGTRPALRHPITRGKHLAVFASTSPSSEGTQRDEPAGGAGSTPTHPAALRSGMQMGSDSPEQQHTFSTPDPSGRGHKFNNPNNSKLKK